MGNKAHIKIDKVVEYCSECPFCGIRCIGYGKSRCYEFDLWCHASTTELIYTNLRFVDIFQKSHRDCAKDFVPDSCPMKIDTKPETKQKNKDNTAECEYCLTAFEYNSSELEEEEERDMSGYHYYYYTKCPKCGNRILVKSLI